MIDTEPDGWKLSMKVDIAERELESNRVYLREITREDAGIIVSWRSKPEVYRFFLTPKAITVDEHLSWFDKRYLSDGNRLDFIACLKKDSKAIGVFGIKKDAQKQEEVEVSYLLDDEYQGYGYAAEIVEHLICLSQKIWDSEIVIAEIHKDNKNSIRLVEKLNFTLKEENSNFRIFQKEINHDLL